MDSAGTSYRTPLIWHEWGWTSVGLPNIPDDQTITVLTYFLKGFFFNSQPSENVNMIVTFISPYRLSL